MKKIILIIIAISLLLIIIFSIKEKITFKSLKNIQNQSLSIGLDKKEYRLGESISFTISNNTQKNVYYFPETCASSIVQVFVIQNNKPILIQGDTKVCMLAPSVETLSPNQSITGKIPEKTLSKMAQGTYKIRFNYSTEKKSRFGIGEHSIVDSETFIMVE